MRSLVRSRKGIIVVLQWLLVIVLAVVGTTTEAGRASPLFFWGLIILAALGNIAIMRQPVPSFYQPTQWAQLFIADTVVVGTAIYFIRGFDVDIYLPYFLIILTAAFTRSIARGVLVALAISAAYLFLVWRSGGKGSLLSVEMLIRVPLFFVIALFTSYLAHGARLQQEAEAESRVLADQVSLLQQLAAGIAHEVRNPLTALNNTLQALERKIPGDDPAKALVEDSLTQVHKVTRIVQETLDMARPPALQLDWLSVNIVLERAVRMALAAVPEGRISVVRRMSPQPLMVRGDESVIEQAFLNLLRNSLEAMPGGGKLSLETMARLVRGREEVGVAISDNGPGIPAHIAERLFQPFYTTKEHGTGLGLVLSRKFVRAHGGDLEMYEAKGGGTEAFVSLPVAGPARSLSVVQGA